MNFNEWLAYGVEQGFCTEQFCLTHDGYPTWEGEYLHGSESDDSCIHMVRLGIEEDWEV